MASDMPERTYYNIGIIHPKRLGRMPSLFTLAERPTMASTISMDHKIHLTCESVFFTVSIFNVRNDLLLAGFHIEIP